MSIKHDNIVPNTWPGPQDTTGIPAALTAYNAQSSLIRTMGTARYLGGRIAGQGGYGAPAAQNDNATRLLLNASIPKVDLPPFARYQAAGNPDSTDYGCGIDSLPDDDLPDLPAPTPIVQVIAFYKANDIFVVGPSNPVPAFDPNVRATQLEVNKDFYVQLRIIPSVSMEGYVPTKFTLTSRIGLNSYTGPADFEGWPSGTKAASSSGDYFRIPGFYIPETGTATLTFSAGQKDINIVFGQGTGVIPVVSTPTQVTGSVQPVGWFNGIQGNISTVYQGQQLQLQVYGPPNKSFVWTTPWGTGTATTDASSNATVTGTAVAAGTWPFSITFADIPTYRGTFLVLSPANAGHTATGGDTTTGGGPGDSGTNVGDTVGDTEGEGIGGNTDGGAGNSSADGTGGDAGVGGTGTGVGGDN